MRQVAAILIVGLSLAGCDNATDGGIDASSTTLPGGTTSTPDPPPEEVAAVDFDDVRDELLEMARVDQEERSQFGEADAGAWRDEERTARLVEIVDEHGWPTPDLVGEDATSAAFLIAQHSDADPGFQQRVLMLSATEVADYPGKAQQVALLTDRVATNTNRPQLYGSQIGCVDGVPAPRPELARPDDVDRLRADADLEPLAQYLARFEQHCTDVAQRPIDAGCEPIDGVSGLFQPDTAILVGELHGTVESPAFVGELACTALSYGDPVIVGLEIPDDETAAVQAFLASDGGPDARAALLTSPFWTFEFADGRQSTAMLDLLDAIRRHRAEGATIEVVLLDATGVSDRDVAMADRLLEAVEATPDGVAITLTGNIHNRGNRGADFDPGYEPMGYLVKNALGDHAVRTLDVQFSGGAAWTCSQDGSCGPRSFDGIEATQLDTAPAVELYTEADDDGFDGIYFVGELSPSAPAGQALDSAN